MLTTETARLGAAEFEIARDACGRFPTAWLVAIVGVAIGLRVAIRAALPTLVFPDEIFQVLEPAHRLIFGTGVMPWEFQIGIRSWLFAGLAALPMALGKELGSDPDTILFPVRLAMAAAATAPVVVSFLWGWRLQGIAGALIAGTLQALWVDNLYYATHTLSEVAAADTLIWAIYLGYPGGSSERPLSRSRLFWSGALLGLTFDFRFHLGPALALALLWIGWRNRVHWAALAAGFLVPVMGSGALDWATWSYPFQSIWLNVWVNVVKGVSVSYGAEPVYYFFVAPLFFWGGAATAIAAAAFAGAYRLPLLAAVAFAIFAGMTPFAHKEYRFVYPATPLLLALAGLGSADAVLLIYRAFGTRAGRLGSLVGLAICFWAMTAIAVGLQPIFQRHFASGSGMIRAFALAAKAPEICGVALYRFQAMTLGRSGLRPDQAFYAVDQPHLPHEKPGFNAIVTEASTLVPDPAFRRVACFADGDVWPAGPRESACVWVRPGVCKPGIAKPVELPWPAQWSSDAVPRTIRDAAAGRHG